jgi:hypothetical protein
MFLIYQNIQISLKVISFFQDNLYYLELFKIENTIVL